MLKTDPRWKKLTQIQKTLLSEALIRTPPRDYIYESYVDKIKKEDTLIVGYQAEYFKKLGFPIEAINRELMGLSSTLEDYPSKSKGKPSIDLDALLDVIDKEENKNLT